MQTIYMLCGLPGTGKSTWAGKKSDKSTLIVNRDSIRTMIHGKYIFDVNYERMIDDITKASAYNILKNGYDLIIDETCTRRFIRGSWINLIYNVAGNDANIICVWFNAKTDINRIDSRGQSTKIWGEVVERMTSCFEPPSMDEGFSKIVKIDITKGD